MVTIMQNIQEKADSQKTKVSATKIRKGSCRQKQTLYWEKMEATYMLSSFDGRSILVVRQADENLAVSKILKFGNFNSKAHLGWLN